MKKMSNKSGIWIQGLGLLRMRLILKKMNDSNDDEDRRIVQILKGEYLTIT